MKLLRRILQIAFLLLFATLLALTTWPLRSPLAVQAFLSLDPLSALAAMLSPERSLYALYLFSPAVLLLIATAFLGRFFCGWVCPLGTCVDLADTVLRRTRRKTRAVSPLPKYLLLVVVLATAPFGGHLFWLLDPIPLLTRTFATVLLPANAQLGNALFAHGHPLWAALGWPLQPLPVHSFTLSVLTGAVFAMILLLGLVSRRYWCRSLCPLGALLGIVGRFGLWRREVSGSCTECRLCSRDCKMGAIPREEPQRTVQAECIQCYDCLDCCPASDTRLAVGRTGQIDPGLDMGRRQFLAACAMGVAYGATARLGLAQEPLADRLLRPPGAVVRGRDGSLMGAMSEDEFLSKCLRCGQCMKVCVTGGLQPAVLEAGLLGFYTPRLVPRTGHCEQGCTACGQVCPSGALVPFTVEDKRRIRLGEARISHAACLCWQAGADYRECLLCAEQCGYGAIDVVEVGGKRRPVVRRGRCTGCGLCEKICPAHDGAAIVVYRRDQR